MRRQQLLLTPRNQVNFKIETKVICVGMGLRNKLVAMPVLRPDDQTAVNDSEIDIQSDDMNGDPRELSL